MERLAWTMASWFLSLYPDHPCARQNFYEWAEDVRPASVLVGSRRLITESPRAWLARMAQREQDMKASPRRRRPRVQADAEGAKPQGEIATAASATPSPAHEAGIP